MVSCAEMSGRGLEASNSFPSLWPPVSSRKALRCNLGTGNKERRVFLKATVAGLPREHLSFCPSSKDLKDPLPAALCLSYPEGCLRDLLGRALLLPHTLLRSGSLGTKALESDTIERGVVTCQHVLPPESLMDSLVDGEEKGR